MSLYPKFAYGNKGFYGNETSLDCLSDNSLNAVSYAGLMDDRDLEEELLSQTDSKQQNRTCVVNALTKAYEFVERTSERKMDWFSNIVTGGIALSTIGWGINRYVGEGHFTPQSLSACLGGGILLGEVVVCRVYEHFSQGKKLQGD